MITKEYKETTQRTMSYSLEYVVFNYYDKIIIIAIISNDVKYYNIFYFFVGISIIVYDLISPERILPIQNAVLCIIKIAMKQ